RRGAPLGCGQRPVHADRLPHLGLGEVEVPLAPGDRVLAAETGGEPCGEVLGWFLGVVTSHNATVSGSISTDVTQEGTLPDASIRPTITLALGALGHGVCPSVRTRMRSGRGFSSPAAAMPAPMSVPPPPNNFTSCAL